MPEPENLLAIHGWSCDLPPDWDVIVNRGEWSQGFVVAATGNVARLNLSWQRRRAGGLDLDRTVARLDRQLRRESSGDLVLSAREALAPGGVWLRWSGTDGDRHVAICADPACPVVFVLRQLVQDPPADLRRIAASCTAVDDQAACRWRIHGLDLDLPPRMRLEGIQNAVGMIRAVWMRYPDERRNRIDQVVVVRRYALARRLLGSLTIHDWFCLQLGPRDRVVATAEIDGVTTVDVDSPAGRLWDRLRRIPDRRRFHLWVEAAADRLVIQESKGRGGPMPCLRRPGSDQDSSPPRVPCTPGHDDAPHDHLQR